MKNNIPIHHRENSKAILMMVTNKSDDISKNFLNVLEVIENSNLSYADINYVLYCVNDYLYKKIMEEKNPLSIKTKD